MFRVVLHEIINLVSLKFSSLMHTGHLWIMFGTLRYSHLRMCRRWESRVLNPVNLLQIRIHNGMFLYTVAHNYFWVYYLPSYALTESFCFLFLVHVNGKKVLSIRVTLTCICCICFNLSDSGILHMLKPGFASLRKQIQFWGKEM